ncbi:prohibitin family protein [Azospirillum sp. TSH100]|uniref:prohibitin family protein n=1 Tax=Azospirillum sp. TSH100 TaxID=652764 RepID=UPI0010AB4496|nr:prohibitin family protein [Azospirillum sp. TSH100]QCG90871.1 prohibitin family protein [Azospirillum sp. TSH100]
MTDHAAPAASATPYARLARAAPVRWLRSWGAAHRRDLLLGTLVFLFVAVYLAPNMLVNVPTGYAGVIWRRFGGGTDVKTTLKEGISVIWPWDKVTFYDMRLQVKTEEYEAIASDGLHIKLTATFRFNPNPDTLGYLHKTVGPKYVEVLLVPSIGSVVRREVSKYLAREIYGVHRVQLQNDIYEGVISTGNKNQISAAQPHPDTGNVFIGPPTPDAAAPADHKAGSAVPGGPFDSDNYIELADVLISGVVLPDRVRAAIERKEEQDQLVQEYTFRLERERFESQRKAIEAQGIRQFQETVQAGISENYLKWRGIEATLRLALSNNAKVVVIGGQNGLPLILNTNDQPTAGKRPPAEPSASEATTGTLDLSLHGNNLPMDEQPPAIHPAPSRSTPAPASSPDKAADKGTDKTAGVVPAESAPLPPVLSPLEGVAGTADLFDTVRRTLDGTLGNKP